MSNNRVVWLMPDDPPDAFPPVADALREPDGLLAAGGDLGIARLLAAYRRGIFPWYEAGQPLLWWSPDPRCVFRQGDFHLSRRLRRELGRSTAEVRINTAFGAVMRACAAPRRSGQGTWITQDMSAAYAQLHDAGWAHSIEIWQDEKLVGGLYGLIIGKVLFGESMFSEQANASKITLLVLDRMLDAGSLEIIDCQVESSHLISLGAAIVPRTRFVELLDQLCESNEPFENWPANPMKVAELLQE